MNAFINLIVHESNVESDTGKALHSSLFKCIESGKGYTSLKSVGICILLFTEKNVWEVKDIPLVKTELPSAFTQHDQYMT